MKQEIGKQTAGKKGATLIEDQMIVGLGSGTTATYFIHALIERCKQGLQIRAVSSSKKSTELARAGGIEVLDLNEVSSIDVTVDGADEIDQQKRMIKGGGGAHVREKILASSSREMVVIVDESKLVDKLGETKLPLEVISYGSNQTLRKIEKLGYHGQWRKREASQDLYVTENGNFLLDLDLISSIDSPESLHEELMQIPGVVDTGFFFNLAKRVIVGYLDGSCKTF